MYRGGGAHVEAAAGAVHQHQQRVAGELPGDHQLLRVTAGKQRGLLFQRAYALHIETRDCLGSLRLQALAAQSEEGTVAAAMDLADTEVLGYQLPASAAP